MGRTSSSGPGTHESMEDSRVSELGTNHLAAQLLCELEWIERQAKHRQTCKRKAVGCSILRIKIHPGTFYVPIEERIIFAHNGPTARQSQSRCTGEKGNCGCPHAEPKAIIGM